MYLELILFTIGVAVIILFDNGLFHLKNNKEEVTSTMAFKRIGFYALLAALFSGYIYYRFGTRSFVEFSTSYFVEIILSVDNVFVFILIFRYFNVSHKVEQKVLLFGVIIAFVLRGFFIIAGVKIVNKFSFALLIFGLFLVYTSVKILYEIATKTEEKNDIDNSPMVKIISKIVPISKTYHGAKFLIFNSGSNKEHFHGSTKSWYFTRAFVVLLVISVADVLFAVDSIPAVFAISQDVYVMYTSNILAVLGLRSLFFAVNNIIDRFHYLKVGLGIVLLIIGIKLCAEVFFHDFCEHYLPAWSMLVLSVGIFGSSILVSMVKK
jgi:tellurite resistance protein TerC